MGILKLINSALYKKRINTMRKIISILIFLYSSVTSLNAQTHTYYLETIRTSDDKRIELLMISGLFTTLAATAVKCVMWYNWSKNSTINYEEQDLFDAHIEKWAKIL
jgi:hypothetical protein